MKITAKNDQKKPRRKDKSHIPFRLNFLFFMVFALFSALIIQLAHLQLIQGVSYQAMVDSTDKKIITKNVPRGVIKDSQGRTLVGNQGNPAITYTKSINTQASKMYQEAKQLSRYIEMDTSTLSQRDQIDFYLSDPDQLKKWNAKLPRSQKVNEHNEKYSDAEIYQSTVSLVAKSFDGLSKEDKEAAAIFKVMSGAYQLSTVYIKNQDVTDEEVAVVSEHLSSLPGISIGTDWQREYPNGNSMRSIIGHVSSEKQGLPEDSVNSLLAEGYQRNDRVGTSYLEKVYEPILKGSKSQSEVKVANNNQVISSKAIYNGQKGKDLTLTIDQEYQKAVEQALSSVYNKAQANGVTQYSDGAYAVAMNPKTGEVLAMAGERHDREKNTVEDDALGVINRTFVMGSAVKGATVLGGLMDGVITPENNNLTDQAIYLPGAPVKKSEYTPGIFGSTINAPFAMQVSSNTYMMALAMKEGNAKYTPHKSLIMDEDIFDKMRGYNEQLGLGVKTGIDLPGEATGIKGPTHNEFGKLAVGSALDLSFGNFDAYTLIQLGQYISAIANGGYRMKPYLVDTITQESDNGQAQQIVQKTQPTVLSKVDATQKEIDVVKQGMYQVVHGTTAYHTGQLLQEIKPFVSGKTGTAQSFAREDPNDDTSKQVETITTSFVGYGPSKDGDPQIAIAVVFPNLSSDKGSYNLLLAKEMFESYYKLNDIK